MDNETLANLRDLLFMEIVAETSWTLNSAEIYALRDLFREVDRLRGALDTIVNLYKHGNRDALALMSVAREARKGGE